jgi:putative endonuclease
MKNHNYYVYIVTNPTKTVLYTGVTNDLLQRITEHYLNRGNTRTFAGKYYCYYLLFFERYQYIQDAIKREKQIKGLKREKKELMIKEVNPTNTFLNTDVFEKWPPEDASLRSA